MKRQQLHDLLNTNSAGPETVEKFTNEAIYRAWEEENRANEAKTPNGQAALSLNLYLRQISAIITTWKWWETNIKNKSGPLSDLWKKWSPRQNAMQVQTILRCLFDEVDGAGRDYTFHPGFQFLADRDRFTSRQSDEETITTPWAGDITFREIRKWINDSAAPTLGITSKEYLQNCQGDRSRLIQKLAAAAGGSVERDGTVLDRNGNPLFVDLQAVETYGFDSPETGNDVTEESGEERLPTRDEFEAIMDNLLQIVVAGGSEQIAKAASKDPIHAWREDKTPPMRDLMKTFFNEDKINNENTNPLHKSFLINLLMQNRSGDSRMADFIIRSRVVAECDDGIIARDFRKCLNSLQGEGGRKHLHLWQIKAMKLAEEALGYNGLSQKFAQPDTLTPEDYEAAHACVDWIEQQGYEIGIAAAKMLPLTDLRDSKPEAYELFRQMEARYGQSEENVKKDLAGLHIDALMPYYTGRRDTVRNAYRYARACLTEKILEIITLSPDAPGFRAEATALLETYNTVVKPAKTTGENLHLVEEFNRAKSALSDRIYQAIKKTLDEHLELSLKTYRTEETRTINQKYLEEATAILAGRASPHRLHQGKPLDYHQASFKYWPKLVAEQHPTLAAFIPKNVHSAEQWDALKPMLKERFGNLVEHRPDQGEIPNWLENKMEKTFWQGLGERLAHENQKLFLDTVQTAVESKNTDLAELDQNGKVTPKWEGIVKQMAIHLNHNYFRGIVVGTLQGAERLLGNANLTWELNPYRRNLKAEQRYSQLVYEVRYAPNGSVFNIHRQGSTGNPETITTTSYSNNIWNRTRERKTALAR